MPLPVYQTADLLAALQALMPRGYAWPTDPTTIQTQVLTGLIPVWTRLHASANFLAQDAFPSTTFELLPQWEESLGLPDPCAGLAPTEQQRRAQVVARFTNSGGQSAAYMIAYAAALGFTITITEYAPFRAGINTAGQPLNGAAWASAWAINAPATTVTLFRAGQSAAGEALASWGNAVLQCEMAEIAPAHTTVIFTY